jgi:hypothetical protein
MNFQDRAIAEIQKYFPVVDVRNQTQDGDSLGLAPAQIKPEGYEYIRKVSVGNGDTPSDDAIYGLWPLKHYREPDHITVSAAFSSIDEAFIEIKLWYKS